MKEEIIKRFNENGFISANHYSIDKIENDKVILKGKITEESLNPYQIVHGGFIFGLGDTAMGLLASLNGKQALTVNANINFVKAAKGNYLLAEANILKRGNNICFLEANIYNDKKELIANMNSTYYYLEERR